MNDPSPRVFSRMEVDVVSFKHNQLLLALRDAVAGIQPILSESASDHRRVLDPICCPESWTAVTSDRQLAILIVFATFVLSFESQQIGAAPRTLWDRLSARRKPLCRPGSWSRVLQRLETDRELMDALARLQHELAQFNLEAATRQLVDRCQTPHLLAYLFELLLVTCDESLKRSRGVYFTPEPVIRYIVRSAEILLREKLCLADGFSTDAPRLRVLDPACGTGLFLQAIIHQAVDVERRRGTAAAESPCRNGSLSECLVGLDVIPACPAAAQFVLELELDRLFVDATTTWSPAFRCINPLEQVEFCTELFAGRIPVIVGNPPYSNFGSHNRGAWILDQLRTYKAGLNERKHNLDDDYVKFLRWGQYWIDRAGRGVLAMITNNSYLTGLTHRQMRRSLLDSFDHIHILNLHGSANRDARTAAGTRDENVFDIRQGVAIGLFTKTGAARGGRAPTISYARIVGARAAKLQRLTQSDVATTDWTTVAPCTPFYFFVPRARQDPAYSTWPRLDELFRQYVSGVQTKCDRLFVGFTPDEVAAKIEPFLRAAAAGQFADDIPRWLRRKTPGVAFQRARIRPYMVAPFDLRWIYYEPRLLGRARHVVMRHLSPSHFGLIFVRQTTNTCSYDNILATCHPASDRVLYSAHGAPFVAPLFLLPEDGGMAAQSNFEAAYLDEFSRRLGHANSADHSETRGPCDPQSVVRWIYGLLHAPSYRRRHAEMLRVEFPRVAWPRDVRQFREVSCLGGRLLDLHLAMSNSAVSTRGPEIDRPPVMKIGRGFPKRTPDGRMHLDTDHVAPFAITDTAWAFHIGGYRVLARWLKQRQDPGLTATDLAFFERLVDTVRHTCKLMRGIDACLNQQVLP